MALPALSKSYQFNVNNTIAAQATDTANFQMLLYSVVNAMIGFASSPWTVVGSCNGSVSGMDAVNRWTSSISLVWNSGASARSWIVLKQTGLDTNFQLLLSLTSNASTNEYRMIIAISPSAGFTGGSTTARPTATDELLVHDGATTTDNWFAPFSSAFQTVHHVIQSTDGQVTYVIMFSGGAVLGYWMFAKVQDAVSGWTAPIAVTIANPPNTTSTITTFGHLNDISTNTDAYLSGTRFGLYYTSEGWVTAMLGENLNLTANEIDGSWPMSPIGVACTDPGKRGRHGRLYDLWWGSTLPAMGSTYPGDSSRQFVQFGHLIFPWNGSVPVIT